MSTTSDLYAGDLSEELQARVFAEVAGVHTGFQLYRAGAAVRLEFKKHNKQRVVVIEAAAPSAH